MKTKTYFAFRIDIWDHTGNSIVEHVAGIDDFEVAVATYWAAVARWPRARITLRQGARIVLKSWTGEVMRTRSQRARSRWLRFNAFSLRLSQKVPHIFAFASAEV